MKTSINIVVLFVGVTAVLAMVVIFALTGCATPPPAHAETTVITATGSEIATNGENPSAVYPISSPWIKFDNIRPYPAPEGKLIFAADMTSDQGYTMRCLCGIDVSVQLFACDCSPRALEFIDQLENGRKGMGI